MCDQQTTELCDKLQSIAIEAETNSDFDVWVGYVSSQLSNKAAITEARPSFTLGEMYDYDISPGIAAFILEDNYRQRIAHEAALARIRELESATIAAALQLPEAERYRLWRLLDEQFSPHAERVKQTTVRHRGDFSPEVKKEIVNEWRNNLRNPATGQTWTLVSLKRHLVRTGIVREITFGQLTSILNDVSNF